MTKDVLLKTEKFNVYIDFFDHLPLTQLFELYLPIVGPKAVIVYEYLYNLKNIYNSSSINKNGIESLTTILRLDIEELNVCCNSLEACGLLKSYVSNKENKSKLIFSLQKPLSYDEFMRSNSLSTTLKQKISTQQLSELRYIFNQQLISNDLVNVSASEDWFNKETTQSDQLNSEINFSELAEKIFIVENKNVIFDSQTKKIIARVFSANKLTIDDLTALIVRSLTNTKNNFCVVDNDKFMAFFQEKTDNSHELINTKIVRNYKIFEYKSNLDDFDAVTIDYKLFNPENYILQLTKSNISIETKKLLTTLKRQFNLTDECINVLIDYCLQKNFGRLEPNYIYKIANTIYSANITDLVTTIKYLQHINSNIKPNWKTIYTDKVVEPIVNNHDDIWG